MQINLLKIIPLALPHPSAYVAKNLDQTKKVCELIGTENTIWSKDEIDVIGKMAARGECDMCDLGNSVTITLKEEKPATNKLNVHVLLAALRSYQNNLDDGDLREIATNCGKEEMPSEEDIDGMCEDLNLGEAKVVYSLPTINYESPASTVGVADFQRLHNALSSCVAAKIDGDQLCFPAEWSDAGNLIHLEADEGEFGFELDSLSELPCQHTGGGVFVVTLEDGRKVDIQPLFAEEPATPLSGKPTVVCEVINQRPFVSLHATEAEALQHAVSCAMENLYAAETPEDQEDRRETQEQFHDTLATFDCVREDDYGVYILQP